MNETKSQRIICAVRGGPESRDTVTCAIDLAIEKMTGLTFLHIVDAEFLGYATVGPLNLIYRELVEVGTFSMLILCDRARQRGVSQVDYIIREGNIRRQLRQFAAETQAKMMVMGRPIRSPGSNAFKAGELEAFVAEMEQEGNLQIVHVETSSVQQKKG